MCAVYVLYVKWNGQSGFCIATKRGNEIGTNLDLFVILCLFICHECVSRYCINQTVSVSNFWKFERKYWIGCGRANVHMGNSWTTIASHPFKTCHTRKQFINVRIAACSFNYSAVRSSSYSIQVPMNISGFMGHFSFGL